MYPVYYIFAMHVRYTLQQHFHVRFNLRQRQGYLGVS